MKIPESIPLTEKQIKTKKTIKILSITAIILFILSIALVAYIFYVQDSAFKFSVNGTQTSKYASDTFVVEGENIYISIKDFAPLMGYKVFNGGYKQYSEDNNKCYIQNNNEVASFEKDSNKLYKTLVEGEEDYEYFDIEEPVKEINGKLYTTPEGIKIACNIAFRYTAEKNKVEVYNLSYYINKYSAMYPNAVISEKEGMFQNQKALLYGMVVMCNDIKASNSNRTYGVYTLDGKELIGIKYNKIVFQESVQEYLVTTSEKKVGIITAKGETKVSPQYDTLKQIDKDLNLYLATNNNKKGVIETNGKILIYLEYDKIGLDTAKYSSSAIKNPYVLFGKMIPVQRGEYWGAFDKYGNLIIPIQYTSFGCDKGVTNNKNVNNVITIPSIEGIVVYKEIDNKTRLYGIMSSEGKELVPVALDTVYSITNAGKEEYYMINQNNTYNVEEYVRKYVFKEDSNKTNTITTNTMTTNTTTSKIEEEKKKITA